MVFSQQEELSQKLEEEHPTVVLQKKKWEDHLIPNRLAMWSGCRTHGNLSSAIRGVWSEPRPMKQSSGTQLGHTLINWQSRMSCSLTQCLPQLGSMYSRPSMGRCIQALWTPLLWNVDKAEGCPLSQTQEVASLLKEATMSTMVALATGHQKLQQVSTDLVQEVATEIIILATEELDGAASTCLRNILHFTASSWQPARQEKERRGIKQVPRIHQWASGNGDQGLASLPGGHFLREM